MILLQAQSSGTASLIMLCVVIGIFFFIIRPIIRSIKKSKDETP